MDIGCERRLTGDVLSWDEVEWITEGWKNDTHLEVNNLKKCYVLLRESIIISIIYYHLNLMYFK